MSLIEIQKNIKAPKGQFNAFGKYKYRSCEDILEAIKPHLSDIPLILTDELVMIGERYYVKATAQYGEHVVTAYAREEENKKGMDGSQVTGAASSYARKYALNGLFAIDDAADSDATNKHDEEKKEEKKPEPKPKKMPKEEFDAIVSFQRAKHNLGDVVYYKVLGQHGFEHCTDIPEELRQAVLDDLRIAYKNSQ
jgi:hypothetical protein